MYTKFSQLLSAAAFVTAVTLAGPILATDAAQAGEKKQDRLPVASAQTNPCENQILGSMTDECVHKIVESAKIRHVQTTVVEVRDEDARISTLIRVPSVEVAKVQPIAE